MCRIFDYLIIFSYSKLEKMTHFFLYNLFRMSIIKISDGLITVPEILHNQSVFEPAVTSKEHHCTKKISGTVTQRQRANLDLIKLQIDSRAKNY